jgi:hypothetical protein
MTAIYADWTRLHTSWLELGKNTVNLFACYCLGAIFNLLSRNK